jgi:hypothetical protein
VEEILAKVVSQMDWYVVGANQLTEELDEGNLLIELKAHRLKHHLQPCVGILDLGVTEELPGLEDGSDPVQYLLVVLLSELRLVVQSSNLFNYCLWLPWLHSGHNGACGRLFIRIKAVLILVFLNCAVNPSLLVL